MTSMTTRYAPCVPLRRTDFAAMLSDDDERVLVAHRALDALEEAIRGHAPTDTAAALLWPCPRCRAAVGEPCTNARSPGLTHAPRLDLGLRARALDVVRVHRAELLHGRRPDLLVASVSAHPLARRLVKLGLVRALVSRSRRLP